MTSIIASKITQLADSNLTLFNQSGETYSAGEVTTLIHTNKGLTLRWKANEPFTHALPFIYAALHKGKKLLSVTAIKPLDNGTVGTELELHF